MAHRMGLAGLTMGTNASAVTTITYDGNTSTELYRSTGTTSTTSLALFDNFSPLNSSSTYYYIVKHLTAYTLNSGYKVTTTSGDPVYQWSQAITNSQIDKGNYKAFSPTPAFRNFARRYSYTGTSQTFTPIIACQHKMECWGASGGTHNSYNFDGKGGYAKGTLLLTNKNDLYVYVGGQGQDNGVGGWNGGGSRKTTWIKDGVENEYTDEAFGGGGATDIRVISDNLYARIIVAGGGGGLNYYKNWSSGSKAGDAGGLCGPIYYSRMLTTSYNYGGTQTSGGIATHTSTQKGNNGSFGVGGNGYWGNGGGGWYGGAGGSNNPYPNGVTSGGTANTGGEIAGGGGSSFISGHPGCVSHASYRGSSTNIAKINNIEYPFESTQMIDGSGMEWTTTDSNQKAGDQSKQMPNPSTANSTYDNGVGHIGNGYARVTCMPYGN